MPGIIGFIGKSFPEGAEECLRKMARALDPAACSHAEFHHEPALGLGRIRLGVVGGPAQPVWNPEKTLCVLMEGELYDTRALRQGLIQRGCRRPLDSDPDLILSLYREFGEGFATMLNGAFVVAIWDRTAGRLLLANDRLGLYPLYLARNHEGLAFASGVRALLADRSVPRRIDHTAVAEFLTFDHLLHDRTLLKDVRLFPQGSVLTWQDGRVAVRRYYEIRYANPYSLRSEADYMEEYLHLLRQAVWRQVSDRAPSALLLSGGLDSRMLLAYLSGIPGKAPLFAFTWGKAGCDDARIARELAAIAGVPHRFFELRPDWLRDKAEEAVSLTDGMANIVNLHALAALDQEVRHAAILYKGFLGDAMMGYALRHQFWANYDEPTRIQAHFQVHADQGVITFSPDEQQRLFTPEFLKETGSSVMDDYAAGMDDAGTPCLADQRVYFDYRQRVPRMTIKGVEVARSKALMRLPFADNDLVEFSLRLPPGLRYGRRLQRNAFMRAFPRMAQVPEADTGLPMMSCLRDAALRVRQTIRWHLASKGLARWAGPARRPYRDYNLWFRTSLRSWVEDILLSRSSLERGYLKPDSVREIVSEHMAGKDYSVRLGALLAIELWHRQHAG